MALAEVAKHPASTKEAKYFKNLDNIFPPYQLYQQPVVTSP